MMPNNAVDRARIIVAAKNTRLAPAGHDERWAAQLENARCN